MQLHLSHYVDEQWLIDNGFKKVANHANVYYQVAEKKKDVSLLVYVDLDIRQCYLGVDNNDVLPPLEMTLVRGEDETEVFNADKVREIYEFDLAFEFPAILYKMINEAAVYGDKKEFLNGK